MAGGDQPYPSDAPLDCHAHIATDAIHSQVAGLRGALVFAVSRTPQEARVASRRADPPDLGLRTHPGLPGALAAISPQPLARAVAGHAVIGEVGLDRRGPAGPRRAALEAVLDACEAQPVLISSHSTERTRQLLAMLRQRPHPGAILHWCNGTPNEITEAAEFGCYFRSTRQ